MSDSDDFFETFLDCSYHLCIKIGLEIDGWSRKHAKPPATLSAFQMHHVNHWRLGWSRFAKPKVYFLWVLIGALWRSPLCLSWLVDVLALVFVAWQSVKRSSTLQRLARGKKKLSLIQIRNSKYFPKKCQTFTLTISIWGASLPN